MDQLIGGYKLFSYGGKRLCQLKKIEGVHLTSIMIVYKGRVTGTVGLKILALPRLA